MCRCGYAWSVFGALAGDKARYLATWLATEIHSMLHRTITPYVGLTIALAGVIGASMLSAPLMHALEAHAEGPVLLPLFVVCILFLLGGIAHYATLPNQIPSFVAAIFLGLAARPLLFDTAVHPHAVLALVSAAVAYILFGGGLETHWEDFRRLFWKIISLSFLGLFVTAFMFSLVFYWLGQVLGYEVTLQAAVLAGAVLASTDPAALIPVLRGIRFRDERRDLKDVAIAESALTEVTGTLLTFLFLLLIGQHVPFGSIAEGYGKVFTFDAAAFLFSQIFWGVVIGGLGYLLLDVLHVRKGGAPAALYARIRHALRRPLKTAHADDEYDADTAFFFAIPLLAFVVASLLGGSGYLASFVVGLLLGTLHHLHTTERFFGKSVEAFLKPAIFVILGCMIDIGILVQYAPIGIVAALLFMFVIRPIAVFLSLAYWLRPGRMDSKDLLFLSLVRETGAIPAALLITLAGSGQGETALVAVGMWVILMTLIVQPPLTPYVSRRLGLTT